MKARSILSVFACATMLAIATSSWAGRQVRAYDYKLDDPHPQKYEDTHLKHNRQVAPYLPSDIKEVPGQVGVHTCNEQGEYAYDPIHGCANYSSTSTNTSWRIRYGQHGAATAIFKLSTRNVDGKQMQVPSLYVQFDENDVNKVIYASVLASKHAAANGSSQSQAVKESPTPPQVPPQQQAIVDCGKLDFVRRIACEAGNNAGLGAAIGAGVRALGK